MRVVMVLNLRKEIEHTLSFIKKNLKLFLKREKEKDRLKDGQEKKKTISLNLEDK